jgi:hypothetical protein
LAPPDAVLDPVPEAWRGVVAADAGPAKPAASMPQADTTSAARRAAPGLGTGVSCERAIEATIAIVGCS